MPLEAVRFSRDVDRSGARQREELRAAHTANALTGPEMRGTRYAGIVSPPCGFPPLRVDEVGEELRTALKQGAADLGDVSQADVARTIKSYRRERRKPGLTVVAEAVEVTA